MQRPVPSRADTIGPWLDNLSFLAWLGSLTTAALVYLFSNDGVGPDGTPYNIKAWGLLLAVFLSEHTFLVVRWGLRTILSKFDSPGRQKERREKYAVRRRYFEDSLAETTLVFQHPRDHVTRSSLEQEARNSTLIDITARSRFWMRQRSWDEVAQVGSAIIEKALLSAENTEEKKTR